MEYFLVSHQLRGDAYGRGGCCELSDGRINKSAISGGGRTNKRDLIKMSLLRVGKVPSGEIPPSNTAINNGLEPPDDGNGRWRQRRQWQRTMATTMTMATDDGGNDDNGNGRWQWRQRWQQTMATTTTMATDNGDNDDELHM